jgi:hypothetical protein
MPLAAMHDEASRMKKHAITKHQMSDDHRARKALHPFVDHLINHSGFRIILRKTSLFFFRTLPL